MLTFTFLNKAAGPDSDFGRARAQSSPAALLGDPTITCFSLKSIHDNIRKNLHKIKPSSQVGWVFFFSFKTDFYTGHPVHSIFQLTINRAALPRKECKVFNSVNRQQKRPVLHLLMQFIRALLFHETAVSSLLRLLIENFQIK